MMNDAQRALLARLRETFDVARQAGLQRFSRTEPLIEKLAAAEDGPGLVKYIRDTIHKPPGEGYDRLVEARLPEWTFEATGADADAEWASEFTDDDREAARQRLGALVEAHRQKLASEEAKAVEEDRQRLEQINADRLARGERPFSPELVAERLAELAAKRQESS